MSGQAPGVYNKNVPSGGVSITTPAQSIPAIMVNSKRGRANVETLVTNFRQYLSYFGGYKEGSYGWHCLKTLLDGYGVNQVYVSRVVGTGGTKATATIVATKFIVTNESIGTDANNFKLIFTADAIDSSIYSLDVVAPLGDDTTQMVSLESYSQLSTDPAEARFIARVLESESKWIKVTTIDQNIDQSEVEIALEALTGGQVAFTGGADPATPLSTDYIGSSTNRTGVYSFENNISIRQLLIPDSTIVMNGESEVDQKGLIAGINTFLANKEYVQYIDSVKENTVVGNVKAEVINNLAVDSKYIAVYYNWAKILDPISKVTKKIPPSIFAFGEWYLAETQFGGTGKAPANNINGLRGVIGLEFEDETALTEGDRYILNELGVNPLIYDDVYKIYGSRNRTSNLEWQQIHVMRTYIKYWRAIIDSSKDLPFKFKDTALYGQIRRRVTNLFRGGDRRFNTQAGDLFNTNNPTLQPYYVICDTFNNTEKNKVIVDWGICVVETAEIIEFRSSLWDGNEETIRVQGA